MKENIHPAYSETEVRCACGNVMTTKSTRSNLSVDICSQCHPFFTGKQKRIDDEGRIGKFMKRCGVSQKSK